MQTDDCLVMMFWVSGYYLTVYALYVLTHIPGFPVIRIGHRVRVSQEGLNERSCKHNVSNQ